MQILKIVLKRIRSCLSSIHKTLKGWLKISCHVLAITGSQTSMAPKRSAGLGSSLGRKCGSKFRWSSKLSILWRRSTKSFSRKVSRSSCAALRFQPASRRLHRKDVQRSRLDHRDHSCVYRLRIQDLKKRVSELQVTGRCARFFYQFRRRPEIRTTEWSRIPSPASSWWSLRSENREMSV